MQRLLLTGLLIAIRRVLSCEIAVFIHVMTPINPHYATYCVLLAETYGTREIQLCGDWLQREFVFVRMLEDLYLFCKYILSANDISIFYENLKSHVHNLGK